MDTALSAYMDPALKTQYGTLRRDNKLTMRYWDDAVLSQACAPVSLDLLGHGDLVEFGELLTKTMIASDNGVGLAANQVGMKFRMLAMRLKEQDKNLVMVNPYVSYAEGSQFGQEGCLSLPTIYDQVERAQRIEVNFYGPDGSENTLRLEDLDARIVLHEIDHLDGLMFFDRMPKNPRKAVLRRWDKIRHNYES
jgi:peptide deformylase